MPVPETRPFRVVANTPIALDMFGLTLAPDDGRPVFAFKPGQWVGVKLPNDPIPNRRGVPYSIAIAPVESGHAIELAVKVYGAFSRMMQTLAVGDRVTVQGPFGVFTLKPPPDLPLAKGEEKLVFFAGGIGVTPLRSMIREALLTNDPREIVLFYSNRTPDAIAYEDEFRALAKSRENFKPVFLLTGEAGEGWDGETGRVDAAKFDRRVPDVADAEFYMCGPRPFMDAVASLLAEKSVDVKKKLHRELFN